MYSNNFLNFKPGKECITTFYYYYDSTAIEFYEYFYWTRLHYHNDKQTLKVTRPVVEILAVTNPHFV